MERKTCVLWFNMLPEKKKFNEKNKSFKLELKVYKYKKVPDTFKCYTVIKLNTFSYYLVFLSS